MSRSWYGYSIIGIVSLGFLFFGIKKYQTFGAKPSEHKIALPQDSLPLTDEKKRAEHDKQEAPSSQLKQPFSGDLSRGFISVNKTCAEQTLMMQGTMPKWLRGTLVGTGPALFDLGPSSVRYWFEGLALMHAWSLADGIISYKNAFLDSSYYQKCMQAGKFPEGFSDKPKSWFSRLSTLLVTPPMYDNANTALAHFGEQVVALSEAPYPVIIDPKTLAVKGIYQFSDKLEGHLTTAYPVYDAATQQWYSYMTQFAATTSSYNVYAMDDTGTRTEIARIPAATPSYMRSMGMTKNFLLLVEVPFTVKPMQLLLGSGSFIDNFEWQPKRGTQLIMINKTTGAVSRYATDAFFIFHHINAFEDQDGALVFDVIAYEDPSVIKNTLLQQLRSNKVHTAPASAITRLIIDQHHKTVTKKTMQAAISFEWPTINAAHSTKNYTFVYGLGSPDATFAHQLLKMNVNTGSYKAWMEQGCYPSAPLFVGKPGSHKEDAGVLLSVVLDSIEQRSFLLILNAKTMKEYGRVYMPQHIPLGLRGLFIPH